MQKWNPFKKGYQPYSVPETWNTPLYCSDMETAVNCVRCGRVIKYGNGYTSKQIHNAHGMGYTVCIHCYRKEWKEEEEANEVN